MYSPKLHWYRWECPFYDKRDNYTDLVGFVTCSYCKKKLREAEKVKLKYPFRKKDKHENR